MIIINTDFKGNAVNVQRTNLKGLTVSFRFIWNERAGAWYCDFESANGANYGIELNPGRLLLSGTNRTTESGDFVIVKMRNTGEKALGFDNLGTDYKLCFLSDDDLKIFEKYGVI